MANEKYYYRVEDSYLCLKHRLNPIPSDYVELTEEQYYKEKKEKQLDFTREQNIPSQILQLKNELAKTDYKAIKYFEGWITEEEYAPIKARRQNLRDKINELEEELQNA